MRVVSPGIAPPPDDPIARQFVVFRLVGIIQLLAMLIALGIAAILLVGWFWPRLISPPLRGADLTGVSLFLAFGGLTMGLSVFRQWQWHQTTRWLTVCRALALLAPPAVSLAVLGVQALLSLPVLVRIAVFGFAAASLAVNTAAAGLEVWHWTRHQRESH